MKKFISIIVVFFFINLYAEQNFLSQTWHKNGKLESEGRYINDKKEGIFNYWNEDGQLIEKIRYKNNIRVHTKVWYDSGKIKTDYNNYEDKGTFYFENGLIQVQREGDVYKKYYENGQIFQDCLGNSCTYFDKNSKKLNGIKKEFFKDSCKKSISSITNYKDGKKEGLEKKFVISNLATCETSLISETNFKDGKKSGLKKEYLFGKLYILSNFKNGYLDGEFKQYSTNSETQKLSKEGSFQNNKKDGVWKLYDEEGKILKRGKYKNGNLIDGEDFY